MTVFTSDLIAAQGELGGSYGFRGKRYESERKESEMRSSDFRLRAVNTKGS